MRESVMRVLFVGLGGIGQRHLRNLRSILGADVEVHAYRVRGLQTTLNDQLKVIPDAALDAQYQVHVHDTLDQGLAVKPEAVFICNPSNLHIPIALKAVTAGCHLFVEKPLSHDLEGVEELTRQTEARGLAGLVGYQLRFHPCVQRLHALVTSGAIGRVLAARVEVGEYLPGWHTYEDYRQMYAARSDLGGGVILSQIHEFDYLYWMFGLPRRVFTVGGHYSSLEIDVEDVASSVMEFQIAGRPLAVQVHQDYVQRPPRRGCLVLGDRGKIVVDFVGLSLDHYDGSGQLVEKHHHADFPRNQLVLDEMNHFLDCVRGRAKPIVSLLDGAQSLRMALAARESMTTGRVVELSA
jgi:predicted dehydrogenase